MKSALSLTLIVCLVGSAIPLAAQERFVEPTSGPIARASNSGGQAGPVWHLAVRRDAEPVRLRCRQKSEA